MIPAINIGMNRMEIISQPFGNYIVPAGTKRSTANNSKPNTNFAVA